MENDYDDALRLRIDDDAWSDDLGRVAGPAPAGATTLLAKTVVISTYPTSAARYYGVQAEAVEGTEVEGGAGTITAVGGNFLALNVGTTIPTAGTNVLISFVGNRWVFSFNG